MNKLQTTPASLSGVKIFGLCCALFVLSCTSVRQEPTAMADTRAADEAAILKTDAAWVIAAKSSSVDAWVAFYTDDAIVLPPNDKVASSKADVRKAVGDLLGLPGLVIVWQPTKVIVARAGDIAYEYGSYDLSFKDAKGKLIKERGKFVEVWRKQTDGSWKCVLDTWNSDLPVEPPPAK